MGLVESLAATTREQEVKFLCILRFKIPPLDVTQPS